MKKIFLGLFAFILCLTIYAASNEPVNKQSKNIQLVKDMFSQVSEARDMSKFDQFYSKDFVLVSNNKTYDYENYKKGQEDIFKVLQSLKVLSYDDIFAENDKVVSRMSIKLTKKTGETHIFYLIAIIHVKDNKIDRVWEITYPTWSDKLPSWTANECQKNDLFRW